jgi:BMFP domain-containing protein YqiC
MPFERPAIGFDGRLVALSRYSLAMAKNPTSELFTTLKGYLNQITDGERTPNEVASALNGWARESAESVKVKIAEEVETQVSKMGFIKRAEFDKLSARVEKLEKGSSAKGASSKSSQAKSQAKSPVKKSPEKKSPAKKIVKKASVKKVSN